MSILLIRGVTLPGAMDGISFYLLPDFDKIRNSSVSKQSQDHIKFVFLNMKSEYDKEIPQSYLQTVICHVVFHGNILNLL